MIGSQGIPWFYLNVAAGSPPPWICCYWTIAGPQRVQIGPEYTGTSSLHVLAGSYRPSVTLKVGGEHMIRFPVLADGSNLHPYGDGFGSRSS